MKITKDTRIIEVLKCPGADRVLAKYIGPGCATCPGAMLETLEFGARAHGSNLEKMMKELNGLRKSQTTSKKAKAK